MNPVFLALLVLTAFATGLFVAFRLVVLLCRYWRENRYNIGINQPCIGCGREHPILRIRPPIDRIIQGPPE